MKKFIQPVLILILITLPTILPFLNSRFFYTQDYIFIARLQQMSTALFSGQFPVRWAPDLRYGEPIFNFYAPLPYYIGAGVNFLGFDIIWTAKILFILGSFLSAGAMFLLGKKLFGEKAGILAAVLYTYAPYKALDMYVRGSLSETWAFIFFPLIFLTAWLLAEQASLKNFILLSLSLSGLFLTHNVTTLMFLPFLLLWWIFLFFRKGKWRIFLHFFLSGLLSLGLAAFFLLPAALERDLIQTKYLIVGYFDFRAHFVAFKQFFSLFWGYGSSVWGLDDGLSFQIGFVNLAVIAMATLAAFYFRKNKQYLLLYLFLITGFIFSVFLQHNKSAFLWEAVPLMAFIQFPWRFLGVSVFMTALIGAAFCPFLEKRLKILYFAFIFLAILSTISYFRPKEYADDSFFGKFLTLPTMQKGVDLTKDYLPVWVKTVDGERFDLPRSEGGEVAAVNLEKTSILSKYSVNAQSNLTLELPVTYFPGWEVRLNERAIAQREPSKLGLIRVDIPKGEHLITAEFKDTTVRKAGNIISLASILLIGALLAKRKLKPI